MSHQILQEQIDSLRARVDEIITITIDDMNKQGLLQNEATVYNEFLGGLDDAFSNAFFNETSHWESLEMRGEDYARDVEKYDNRD